MPDNYKAMDKFSNIVLPDINIKNTFGIKLVSRAVSLTLLVILLVISVTLIVIFIVPVESSIETPGFLEPQIKKIHNQEGGIIKNIFVKSGDTISVNEKLAAFDSLHLMSELFEVRSEIKMKKNAYNREHDQIIFQRRENQIYLEKAESQLIKAKASFREKSPEFFPDADIDSLFRNYIPGTHITLDYAVADIKSAYSEISNYKLMNDKLSLKEYDLTDLKISLEKLIEKEKFTIQRLKNLEIISGVKGVLITEAIDELPGTYVAEGKLLFEIADLKKWSVTLFVPEEDIHKISPGNFVKVEVQALKDSDSSVVKAIVTSVADERNSIDQYSNFPGYRITAELQDPELNGISYDKLKSGFLVTGNIITETGTIASFLWKYLRTLK